MDILISILVFVTSIILLAMIQNIILEYGKNKVKIKQIDLEIEKVKRGAKDD